MANWEPAEKVQKNASGEYRAMIGGEWVPVANAQKNAAGQYRVDRGVAEQPQIQQQSAQPAQPAKEPTLLERFMAKHPSLAQPVRQAGLTARYALEGVGNIADTLDAPVRVPMGVAPGLASRVSDSLGLPSPETPQERIIGDASRMVASGGGMVGASGKIANLTTGTANKAAQIFASNPVQQISSAAGAGAAGGYAKEEGAGGVGQFVAALAGGIAAPFAMGGANRLMQAFTAAKQQPIQLDVKIDSALKESGITLSELPQHVQNGIRNDVGAALKTGGVLSPDAVRRLADYRLLGATPTVGTLTLDPALVSQQKNLAKLGINSKDAAAQSLGRVENENNATLIQSLNKAGASTADNALSGGQKIMGALSSRDDAAKTAINKLYEEAKATSGRDLALDPHHFSNKANDLLDEALLGGKLPSDVRALLNNAATGKMPLNVNTAEQLKTRIGELQRSSIDGAERKALGMVRQALDDTPLLNDGAGLGKESIDAFNKARATNRAWMGIVEKTPALQAVRDGVEPDKFVQQFIVGNGAKANTADLKALHDSVKSNPSALKAVREQITAHLKAKALNGAADEVGSFSQSAYNKALNAMGDNKLGMFFTKEELNHLRAIGRVSSYEQFQPRGGAVNNSNTAGTLVAGLLDRLGSSPLLSKIPFGSTLQSPVQNISIGIKSKGAMDVKNALATMAQKDNASGLMLSPALLMGTGQ
jgi:hypothetical protein